MDHQCRVLCLLAMVWSKSAERKELCEMVNNLNQKQKGDSVLRKVNVFLNFTRPSFSSAQHHNDPMCTLDWLNLWELYAFVSYQNNKTVHWNENLANFATTKIAKLYIHFLFSSVCVNWLTTSKDSQKVISGTWKSQIRNASHSLLACNLSFCRVYLLYIYSVSKISPRSCSNMYACMRNKLCEWR